MPLCDACKETWISPMETDRGLCAKCDPPGKKGIERALEQMLDSHLLMYPGRKYDIDMEQTDGGGILKIGWKW